MRIGVPRALIVALAAVFSGYHVILGLYTIDVPANPLPVLAAMVLYVAATAGSLSPGQPERMPTWMAGINVAVCAALPWMIAPQLDLQREGGLGYATWYVAAVGTLMTITSTRRRHLFAWIGVGTLVIHTLLWGGPLTLLGIGVVGSIVWVAISHLMSRALASATRDSAQFAAAEREATNWQAAQDAHLFERQVRLGKTAGRAVPLLQEVVQAEGILTEEQRLECLYLEAGIRDEIRGRRLLNDNVRQAVLEARRRGSLVTLFDEGGLDDIPEEDLDASLDLLAEAINQSAAKRIIARTAPADSALAVTVVGLTPAGDGHARDLGRDEEDDEDDEVDLWLEIPKPKVRVAR